MPNEMKPTPRLIDLAELTGFSVATISRALADHPAISAETKARVKMAAEAHGYPLRDRTPQSGLAGPKRRDRNRICIVMPAPLSVGNPLANPFELSLLGGIGAALQHDLTVFQR